MGEYPAGQGLRGPDLSAGSEVLLSARQASYRWCLGFARFVRLYTVPALSKVKWNHRCEFNYYALQGVADRSCRSGTPLLSELVDLAGAPF